MRIKALMLLLTLVAVSAGAEDPTIPSGNPDNHTDTIVSNGPVNVSVVDGVGFSPTQHGGRITTTFLNHTDQSKLHQITGFTQYQLGGRNIFGTNRSGIIRHVLNRDGGVFWTSTDDSPAFNSSTAQQWQTLDGGRPVHKSAKLVVDWLAGKNTLIVSSLENSTASAYCDDEAPEDNFIPLCGAIDDYAAYSGVGLDRILFAGAIAPSAGADLARSAVKAGGVFEVNTIYVDSPDGSTSHAAPVLAAYATNVSAANPTWTATQLRSGLMTLTESVQMNHYNAGVTEQRTIRVLRTLFDETATISPMTVEIVAGGTTTYTVVLDEEPSATATVDVRIPTDSGLSAFPESLTFTTEDWSNPQTVTLIAASDATNATIKHSGKIAVYESRALGSVGVSILQPEPEPDPNPPPVPGGGGVPPTPEPEPEPDPNPPPGPGGGGVPPTSDPEPEPDPNPPPGPGGGGVPPTSDPEPEPDPNPPPGPGGGGVPPTPEPEPEPEPPPKPKPPPPPPRACGEDIKTVRLLNERFEVEVEWWQDGGPVQRAEPTLDCTDGSAMFWFFEPANWEILAKVLDGCAVNGYYWVFAAATTDLGYRIQVKDLVTKSEPAIYINDPGLPAPAINDNRAFPCQ